MTDLHTIRGVTGTINQLMTAFGVQVTKSVIHRRMTRDGMSLERALLYHGRKPPLRPSDPLPVPEGDPDLTPWERAQQIAEDRYGCDLREALILLVAIGFERYMIAETLGLMITPQHYDGLMRKVAAVHKERVRP